MAAGEVDGRGDRIARQKEQRITSALNCRSGAAKKKKKNLNMMTLKQWDILKCEQNKGCRNRKTKKEKKKWEAGKRKEEGQDNSSDPCKFSEIGITKSWKELIENIAPLLPDDENVSVTWHHRVKPVSFPRDSAGLPSDGLCWAIDTREFLQRPKISKAFRV